MFFVFAGPQYYAAGGAFDFVGTAISLTRARNMGLQALAEDHIDWYQIAKQVRGEFRVLEFQGQSYGYDGWASNWKAHESK